jgi:MFS family permease
MRLEPGPGLRTTSSWIDEMREGVRWVRGNSKARVFLTLVMVTSVFGLPYTILLPVFARDILDVGSRGLGFLTGATGLGAVIGALYLAARESSRSRGGLISAAMGLLGASLVAFSLSRSFPLSMALLVLTGAAMITQLATSNTLLQLLAPAELRGRVVGFFMLAFMGMAPLGSLLAGLAARSVGTPAAVLTGGVVCLATGVWFATRLPALRRETGSRETDPTGEAG